DVEPGGAERGGCAAAGHELDTELAQPLRELDHPRLVVHRQERTPDLSDLAHASSSIRTRRPSASIRPSSIARKARGSRRCSISWILDSRESRSSSGRISTASWRTIGPVSVPSSTRWTVTPVTRTPYESASPTAWVPGNEGRSAGCTLSQRPS